MKKIMSILMAAAVAGIFSITSCKKYEEGPGLSFSGKKGRVANVWKVSATYDKGVKDTWSSDTQLYYDSYYTVEFTKDGKVVKTNATPGVAVVTTNGVWEFSDDKTEIMEKMEGDDTFSSIGKIIKLKKDEMWIGEPTTKDEDPQDYLIYVTK